MIMLIYLNNISNNDMNTQTQTQKRHYHTYKVQYYEWDSINGEYLVKDEPFTVKAIDSKHLITRLEKWLQEDIKEAEENNWAVEGLNGDADSEGGDIYFYATKGGEGGEAHTVGYYFELVK